MFRVNNKVVISDAVPVIEGKVLNNHFKAKDKSSAVTAIECKEHRCVQLDYPNGVMDMAELGVLGKRYNVLVMYVSQARVLVDSVEALEAALEQSTYQYRYIEVQCDLSDDEFNRYNAMAKKVDAVLVRKVEQIYAL